jgi:hypothetical protein
MEHEKNIDTVTVRTTRDTVVIPWESQQLLLERLRRRDDPAAATVVGAFEDVGASSPVALSPEGEALLAVEVETWLEQASTKGLPDGIFDLRNALIDEEDLNRR